MSEVSDAKYLFKKLREGVNRGLKIFNIRSKEAYDTVLIRNRIRNLRKRRSDTALEMGNMLYRTYKYKGIINQDIIESKCKEIEGIEKEIEKSEQELEFVHINADKALGSVKALVKATPISICECGAEIYEGSIYCSECSKKVEQN